MKTLIKNATILPAGGETTVTGSIAIEGNILTHIGSVPESFTADRTIDAAGMIAMPGLVNAHVHSPMCVFRNLADDLSFDDWLFGKIIPAESKLTEDDVYWCALLGMIEMIKSGTTCFADMYLHMESVARAALETGMRANLSFGPIISDVRGNGLIVEMDKCADFVSRWQGKANGRIKTCLEIHSVYLFDAPSITGAARLAKELEVGIHIHLSESDSELARSREMYGLTPVAAADSFGVFEVPAIAAHCVKLDETDIALLKQKGVSPVHCPSSNLKLGNGFAPAPRLLNEGVNLCLGTDGCASNNNLNMFEEMHLAALIHKGDSQNPQVLPASQVVRMATENGGKALGFSDVGRLAPGYKADLILINANQAHLCPVNDPCSAVVYSVQAGDVDTVVIDGEVVMRGRRLAKIDEAQVIQKVCGIAQRVCD
ncbi:MAG: amidohydrolase [Oscillospiraceae bacterium]|nr:amidohydrolase [Oscillospiraceae bacterium]